MTYQFNTSNPFDKPDPFKQLFAGIHQQPQQPPMFQQQQPQQQQRVQMRGSVGQGRRSQPATRQGIMDLFHAMNVDGSGMPRNAVERQKAQNEMWELKFPGSAERMAKAREMEEQKRAMGPMERAFPGWNQMTPEERGNTLREQVHAKKLMSGEFTSQPNSQGGRTAVSKYGTGSSRMVSPEEAAQMQAQVPLTLSPEARAEALFNLPSQGGTAGVMGQNVPIREATAQLKADNEAMAKKQREAEAARLKKAEAAAAKPTGTKGLFARR